MSVDIVPNTKEGLAASGANALKVAKALAAIEQINTDLAAIPTATNADVKDMVERLLKTQRQIIKFLMKSLDE